MASSKTTRISIRGEQTRDQIMTAARRLFAERGYHQTSVYDLFERAGITKGAFFHHWKTKEDLALAVFDALKENFEKEFFAVKVNEGRARAQLDYLLSRLMELSSAKDWSYGRIFWLWTFELDPNEDKIGPLVHNLKMRWCNLWKDLIQKAQQEHDLRGDISAENLSFLVAGAICGVQLLGRSSTPQTSRMGYETLRRALLS